jgi:hypothetical protein
MEMKTNSMEKLNGNASDMLFQQDLLWMTILERI